MSTYTELEEFRNATPEQQAQLIALDQAMNAKRMRYRKILDGETHEAWKLSQKRGPVPKKKKKKGGLVSGIVKMFQNHIEAKKKQAETFDKQRKKSGNVYHQRKEYRYK